VEEINKDINKENLSNSRKE